MSKKITDTEELSSSGGHDKHNDSDHPIPAAVVAKSAASDREVAASALG